MKHWYQILIFKMLYFCSWHYLFRNTGRNTKISANVMPKCFLRDTMTLQPLMILQLQYWWAAFCFVQQQFLFSWIFKRFKQKPAVHFSQLEESSCRVRMQTQQACLSAWRHLTLVMTCLINTSTIFLQLNWCWWFQWLFW